MGANTRIEWTDHTFNPWWGCVRVGPECDHCYAEEQTTRFFGKGYWGAPLHSSRRMMSPGYWKQPFRWNEQARKEGRRHRVFCASMADVFEANPQVVVR